MEVKCSGDEGPNPTLEVWRQQINQFAASYIMHLFNAPGLARYSHPLPSQDGTELWLTAVVDQSHLYLIAWQGSPGQLEKILWSREATATECHQYARQQFLISP